MKLERIEIELTVCKIADPAQADLDRPFTFLSRTDGELSLVCPTACVPADTLAREDGWRAIRVAGSMDFGLVGILANLAKVLADGGVPLFAISTFDTDYILVKAADHARALALLRDAGHEIA